MGTLDAEIEMELLVEQLEKRVAEIGRWLEAEVGEAAEVRIVRADGARARNRDFDDSSAPILAPGGDWREVQANMGMAALLMPEQSSCCNLPGSPWNWRLESSQRVMDRIFMRCNWRLTLLARPINSR